jgi:hypothetical protein
MPIADIFVLAVRLRDIANKTIQIDKTEKCFLTH